MGESECECVESIWIWTSELEYENEKRLHLLYSTGASTSMGETFWDWIRGDDARALDPQMAQDMLAAFLIPTEKVQMAFRAGPDLFVLTNKYVLVVVARKKK